MGQLRIFFIFTVNLYIILYSHSSIEHSKPSEKWRRKKCWKCQTQTTKIFSKIFHPQLTTHNLMKDFSFSRSVFSSLGDFSDFLMGFSMEKSKHSLSCEERREIERWKATEGMRVNVGGGGEHRQSLIFHKSIQNFMCTCVRSKY